MTKSHFSQLLWGSGIFFTFIATLQLNLMTDLSIWRTYFQERHELSEQIKHLISKYNLSGTPTLICESILDMYDSVPNTNTTIIPDLAKMLMAFVNEKKVLLKSSVNSIAIEGKERIERIVEYIEQQFISEIDKYCNKVYFLRLYSFLKWEYEGKVKNPAGIELIHYSIDGAKEFRNSDAYCIYDTGGNTLNMYGISVQKIETIYNIVLDTEKNADTYYLSYLLNNWFQKLITMNALTKTPAFITNEHAAFLYDLLEIFQINTLGYAKSNIEKRDKVRTCIRRINKLIDIH